MEEKDMLWQISENSQLVKLAATNQYTNRFGLTLSDENALMLVQERRDILKEQRRVEFGEGILPKLIFAFCDSAYIYQENYVEMIGRLQEIFYLYKNESMDEVTDDELISYMKEMFEGECMGSLDYLEDTCLEEFARNIRRQTQKFIGRYSEDEQ